MQATRLHLGLLSVLPLCGGLAGCVDESASVSTDEESSQSAQESAIGGGFVYAMTNDASHNAVVRYARHVTGRLAYRDTTLTGGRGTGSKVIPALDTDGVDPLTSQDSLTLSANHRTLIASNTGDDTVTAFRVDFLGELHLADRVSSGGRFPNSIAIFGDLVFVSNAGDPASGAAATVVGFRLTDRGTLRRIPGAQRATGVQATHALFSPDGTRLVVSDVASNKIAVFPVHRDGTLGEGTFNVSAGPNPFGMIFSSPDTLLVSEAAAITPGASSVSSYRLRGTTLTPISPAVANGQTAACWLSITPDHRFAYSSNTANFGGAGGAGDISIYSVSRTGELHLIQGDAVPRPALPGTPSSGPVDSMISFDGRFLYQQYSGLGVIGAFRIGADGGLTALPDFDGTGLPVLGAEGLDGF